jgi:hypothetical protein
MVHFLSGTHPALGNAWPDPLLARVISRRLEELRASGRLPRVAVRARGPHAGRALRLLNSWLAANGYERVWSNGTFAILVPKAEVVPESTGGPAGSAD